MGVPVRLHWSPKERGGPQQEADHPGQEGRARHGHMGPEQCGSSRGLERLGAPLSDCGPMWSICLGL